MNDYQEYRSYGSYLGRVFAIIIAFLLLVFAVWGVVRLASDDEEETLGDSSAPSFVVEDGESESGEDGSVAGEQSEEGQQDPDLFVSGATTDDNSGSVSSNDGASATGDEAGQTLSTNTDETGSNGSAASTDGTAVAGATTDDNLPSTGAELLSVIPIGIGAFVLSKTLLPKPIR